MAVGFKNGTTDIQDIFVEKSQFTAANLAAMLRTVDGAGSGIDAAMLEGYPLASLKCSGCSWACGASCGGTCTGGCSTACTGCTGCSSCTGTCTGCSSCGASCGGCGGCQGSGD